MQIILVVLLVFAAFFAQYILIKAAINNSETTKLLREIKVLLMKDTNSSM